MALVTFPRQFTVDINGEPRVGAKLFVYEAGTSDTREAYTTKDLSVLLNPPILALEGGLFPAVYVDPTGGDYKIVIQDIDGTPIYTEDNLAASADLDFAAFSTQSVQTPLLGSFSRTRAEENTGIAVTDFSYSPIDIHVTRFGIVPNNQSKRASNASLLQALLDPQKQGPVGRLVFPPIFGPDTVYYFGDLIEVRDGIRMDFCGCTIDFKKTRESSDDTYGCFTFVRDVAMENGTINVDMDGTGGVNAGSIMRIGSRVGYPFGSATNGLEDEDLATPQGNILLRNLRLKTNNPAVVSVLFLGGLRNVRVDNVTFDGSSQPTHAFYYEFGFWHHESSVSNIKSSHGSGLHFSNIHVTNLKTVGTDGAAIGIVGAADALIENLTVDTAISAVQFRPGEALYYNPGGVDVGLVKRCITMRNIRGKNLSGNGLSLVGAESNAVGYLSGLSLTNAQQRDLMRFAVDGFIISAAGSGINVSGPCDIRNGTLNGTAGSGQLAIGDDCIRGTFTNIEVLNSSTHGVRAHMDDKLSGMTARLKTLVFNNCRVAGNLTGYLFGNTKSVKIIGGRIGYQTALDGSSESTQNVGISVDQTVNGGGVYAYGVDVATAGGSAYSITGTITNPCGVFNPKGTVTFTGSWDVDGTARASATDIAAAANYPNTAGKYAGRRVQDTSNNRLMVARGATATDPWDRADGGASVTPS